MNEPKYQIVGDKIVNRASGEAIPEDEPVIIFRARDVHAAGLIREDGPAHWRRERDSNPWYWRTSTPDFEHDPRIMRRPVS